MSTSLRAQALPALQESDTFSSRPTTSNGGILHPQEAGRHFDLRRYSPAGDLARYVERLWAVHWDLPGASTYQAELIPHPCVNLTLTPAGAMLHGVGTQRSRHPLSGAGTVFGVKFRPGGFAAATGLCAASLTDRSVPLREVFGPAADQLAEALRDARGDPERQRRSEEFLRHYLAASRPEPDPGYPLLVRIIGELLGDRRITRVDQLAERHHMSVRTLQRLFHRYVGVGPKWVIRRYRMHDGAQQLATGTVTDPAALAVALGWFDQAHFTRDFTALIGVSPMDYVAACVAAGDREPTAVLSEVGYADG